MEEHLSNKAELVCSESSLHLSSLNINKNWQTPKLTELNYNQTSEMLGETTDGGVMSS